MQNEDAEFDRNIEKLIRLFRKLKTDLPPSAYSGMDPKMLEQMDFLIRNFELMKTDPSAREVFKQMGVPFRDMLNVFIKNLSTELGEDILDEPMLKAEQNIPLQLNPRDELIEIDRMLSSGNLSDEETDKLLDKRLDLLKQLKNK
ncbi:MAG: hypothetical protein Q7J34_03675 [Bacteroidales bacterium]|nr:hypothetical protein [Bacteroidales bacterium]